MKPITPPADPGPFPNKPDSLDWARHGYYAGFISGLGDGVVDAVDTFGVQEYRTAFRRGWHAGQKAKEQGWENAVVRNRDGAITGFTFRKREDETED